MHILVAIRDDLLRAGIVHLLNEANNDLCLTETNELQPVKHMKEHDPSIDWCIFDASNDTLESDVFFEEVTSYVRESNKESKSCTSFVALFEELDPNLMHYYYENGINACIERASCKAFFQFLANEGCINGYFIPSGFNQSLNQKSLENSSKINVKNGTNKSAELSLTKRQEQILAFIRQGKTNREIGRILKLSEGTIRTHVTNIFNRLNVSNRTEAVHVATQYGLV